MSKKEKNQEVVDKESVRDKRAHNAEHRDKKKKSVDGKKFNRQRARQRDSEHSREIEYFYD